MAFTVAARTVLELGAELISSDAVAIYELVKNAIDAQSRDGVTIELRITLPRSAYVDALYKIQELAGLQLSGYDIQEQLEGIKASIAKAVLPDALSEQRRILLEAVKKATTPANLQHELKEVYISTNWIEFRDTGSGMSQADLSRAYMVIGTSSRKRVLDRALESGNSTIPLGEKGVGRLSVMRLGSHLKVVTATARDEHLNELVVDWSAFEDLDKLVGDIKIEPTASGKKPDPAFSGTNIRITDLKGNWSPTRIDDIAKSELSRFTDPFPTDKRRYRIAVEFNGRRIDIPRLDHFILGLAHAKAMGHYEIVNGKARLEVRFSCIDLGKGNPPEESRFLLEQVDLRSITKDPNLELPQSALRSVGPFQFELHWYNRRLLTKAGSIDRKSVLALQAQWSGIMLFRDGYRVFPYGDDEDDWLGLDRKALASQGYKLNKQQFIGRVSISRSANPHLMDQTNREGLKDCDEKTVLIEVLRFVIQDRLHRFMEDVMERHLKTKFNFEQAEKRVDDLQEKARNTLRDMGKKYPAVRPKLVELQTEFDEMQEYFGEAKERAGQVEDERDRMLQLAGIGLMLEVVAHELTRSTETALNLLAEASRRPLPADVAALFNTLQAELRTMNKRLRVLDPLSISARQRNESFDLVELVRDVFAAHEAQFRRHRITTKIHVAKNQSAVAIKGVRGMFVQILENLVQNSVYWMDLRSQEEDDYHPTIDVYLGPPPIVMEFTDNGPGIQPSLREEVFKAFFSTKGKSKRQGLGLFIARDCAVHHGGQLYLADDHRTNKNRLNTFVLELPAGEK